MFAIVQKRRLRVAGSLPKKKHRGKEFPPNGQNGTEAGVSDFCGARSGERWNIKLPRGNDARGSWRAGRPPDLFADGEDSTETGNSDFCGARSGKRWNIELPRGNVVRGSWRAGRPPDLFGWAETVPEWEFPTSAVRGREKGGMRTSGRDDARGSWRAGRPPDLFGWGENGTEAGVSDFCGARSGERWNIELPRGNVARGNWRAGRPPDLPAREKAKSCCQLLRIAALRALLVGLRPPTPQSPERLRSTPFDCVAIAPCCFAERKAVLSHALAALTALKAREKAKLLRKFHAKQFSHMRSRR